MKATLTFTFVWYLYPESFLSCYWQLSGIWGSWLAFWNLRMSLLQKGKRATFVTDVIRFWWSFLIGTITPFFSSSFKSGFDMRWRSGRPSWSYSQVGFLESWLQQPIPSTTWRSLEKKPKPVTISWTFRRTQACLFHKRLEIMAGPVPIWSQALFCCFPPLSRMKTLILTKVH